MRVGKCAMIVTDLLIDVLACPQISHWGLFVASSGLLNAVNTKHRISAVTLVPDRLSIHTSYFFVCSSRESLKSEARVTSVIKATSSIQNDYQQTLRRRGGLRGLRRS